MFSDYLSYHTGVYEQVSLHFLFSQLSNEYESSSSLYFVCTSVITGYFVCQCKYSSNIFFCSSLYITMKCLTLFSKAKELRGTTNGNNLPSNFSDWPTSQPSMNPSISSVPSSQVSTYTECVCVHII